jgi:hypothetical protein
MWEGQALALLDQLCAIGFHSVFVGPIEGSLNFQGQGSTKPRMVHLPESELDQRSTMDRFA